MIDDVSEPGSWADAIAHTPHLARQVEAGIALGRLLDVAAKLDGGCRGYGCTDDQACVTDDAPCHWVEVDLCSACANREDTNVND